jgi:hypothetical protein
MAPYRLGVRDKQAADVIFWYDQESYDDACTGWRLIRDYGRDGVTAAIQRREVDGHWSTILGDTFASEGSHR